MKTAISIPDDVFRAAERHVKRTGVSRSHFYTRALSEYLKSLQRTNVKENLDRVYSSESSSIDPILDAMQRASIKQEDW